VVDAEAPEPLLFEGGDLRMGDILTVKFVIGPFLM
jgi:hypothetical protein